MKKLLSIAVVTTLLTTAINANTITLNATVPLSTNVTLGGNTATLAATTAFTAFDAPNKDLLLTTDSQVLMDEEVNLLN
jgi:phosphate/sulfate permease